METYKELKNFCDIEIQKYPQLQKKYKKEIIVVKRFYDNNRNIFNELKDVYVNGGHISERYVIPYLLGFTNTVINKKPVYKQVKSGASGGKHLCHPQ